MRSGASEAVGRFLSAHPGIPILAEVAKKHQVQIFVVGGALRDVISGRNEVSDVDVRVECPPATAKAMRDEANAAFRAQPASARPSSVDVRASNGVIAEIMRFDFTVNCLAYELQAGILHDPSGRGLDDIAARRLVPVAKRWFTSTPRNHLRAFRLSQMLGFALDDSTTLLLRSFAPMLGCADREMRCSVMSEFLRVLSAPAASSSVRLMHELRTLHFILPELLPSLLSPGAPALGRLDELERRIEALQGEHRTGLHAAARFQIRSGAAGREQSTRAEWSPAALGRLVLLFATAVEDTYRLERSGASSAAVRNDTALTNIFSNISVRLSAHPLLAEKFEIACVLLRKLGPDAADAGAVLARLEAELK